MALKHFNPDQNYARCLTDVKYDGESQVVRLPFLVLSSEVFRGRNALVVTDLTSFSGVNVLKAIETKEYHLGPNATIDPESTFTIWLIGKSCTYEYFTEEYQRHFHTDFDPNEFNKDYYGNICGDMEDDSIYGAEPNKFKRHCVFIWCTFYFNRGPYGFEGLALNIEIVSPENLSQYYIYFQGLFNRLYNKCDYNWLVNEHNLFKNYIYKFVELNNNKANKRDSQDQEIIDEYERYHKIKRIKEGENSTSPTPPRSPPTRETIQTTATTTTTTTTTSSSSSRSTCAVPPSVVAAAGSPPPSLQHQRRPLPKQSKSNRYLPPNPNSSTISKISPHLPPNIQFGSNILYQSNFKRPAIAPTSAAPESQSMDIFNDSQALTDMVRQRQTTNNNSKSISYLKRLDVYSDLDETNVTGFLLFTNTADFIQHSAPYENYLIKANYRYNDQNLAVYRSFRKDSSGRSFDLKLANFQIALNDTALSNDEFLVVDFNVGDTDKDGEKRVLQFFGVDNVEELAYRRDLISRKLAKLESINTKITIKVHKKIVENKLGIKTLKWIYNDTKTIDDMIML